MRIDDFLTKYYPVMYETIGEDRDIQAYESKLKEDVFQDVIFTVYNKYPDRTAEYDEEEMYEYWKKTLLMEYLFVGRKKSSKITYIGSLMEFSGVADPETVK